MTKLKQKQFYCVSCRAKRTAASEDICVKKYKNKRSKLGYVPALKGVCKVCHTPLTKFIKHKDVDRMTDKYGKY